MKFNPRNWKGLILGLSSTLLGIGSAMAQNPTSVDIDLVQNSNLSRLEVRVRANGQMFGDVMSALTFTVRSSASAPDSLASRVVSCIGSPFTPVATVVTGGFKYRTYNGFSSDLLSDDGCPWPADTWVTIGTILVTNVTGCKTFQIVNDAYTAGNNRNYFVSLGGINKTGVIEPTAVDIGLGATCDDGNANTTGDVYTANCVCAGTQSCTPPSAVVPTSNSPICAGSTLNLNVTFSGSTATGFLWTGTGTFSPSNTVQNPTVTGAAGGTYGVTVTNACGNASGNTSVTVNQAANAGSNGTKVFCSNGAAANLFSSLGGSPAAGGTWTPAGLTGGSLGTFTPGTNTAQTYTYTVTGTAPCANATATVAVTVNQAANAGGNGSITLCSSGAPVNLFSSLGGSPSAGGTWTPAGLTGGSLGTFTPGTNTAQTYTYTVTGTAP